MSINNETLRNVAQAALDIMEGKIKHPNQQKLDVHEPEKDELTADDFKKLRAMKKEETEVVDEAMQKADVPAYLRKQQGEKPLTVADVKAPRKDSISAKENLAKARNEEVEQIDEYKSVGGVYKHQGTYGRAKDLEAGETDWDKEDKKAATFVKPEKKKYGARQNRNYNTKTYKESFTGMLDAYKEGGIKGLFESLHTIQEEPTNDEFKKELEDQKASAEGKKKQPDLAKGTVKAVQVEEIEVFDADEINGVEVEQLDELSSGTLKSYVNKAKPEVQAAKAERADARDAGDGKTANDAYQLAKKRTAGIKQAKAKLNAEEIEQVEERTLTEPETKKKEEIVKSMKKGMAGFKERYGDRAKEVMYATATKQAKEKA